MLANTHQDVKLVHVPNQRHTFRAPLLLALTRLTAVTGRILSPLTMLQPSLLLDLANLLQRLARHLNVGLQHRQFPIGTTSWSLRTQAALQRQGQRSASRSIQPLSNAICAPRSLLVPTIFVRIFELIPMNDPLSAQSVQKPLRASMIVSDTRVYTVVKRNLCAEVSSGLEGAGAAEDASPAPTHLADTFAAKPAASVSSRFSTRKP